MKADVVVVGGGPGGSACAMYLSRAGISSIIVEQESFPRYHIGESLTGEAGGVLRDLGLLDNMTRAGYPIKHGVKVYGPNPDHYWFVPVMMRTKEWELSPITTWNVRRSLFDTLMLDEAQERGATVIRGKALKPIVGDDDSVHGIQVQMSDGGIAEIRSELLLDCSGQATWLANHGGVTGPKYMGAYDKQVAFFSQVVGMRLDGGEERSMQRGNALIFYKSKYHWAWAIPIDDEVTSVGIVIPSAYFLDKRERKTDFVRRELRELNRELSDRLPEITLVEDVHVIPNYSYQIRGFTGKGFICVGDAHRFIDPIFSFGVYVTMKEGYFLAPVIKAYLEGANRDAANPFVDYQVFAERGIDVFEDTIDLFWEQPLGFATFVHNRYRELMIDILAGRVYERQPNLAVQSFRRFLKRERSYDADDYSIPIGSRFHPERAPIWQVGADTGDMMEETEAWMGAR